MTRVLHRPMFKMGGSIGGTDRQKHFGMADGGSTSGITSGLERPGYYNGKRVASPEEISEYIDTIKAMGGPRTPPLSDFLMNFGLNLMTASPRGNIFTTAAEAAKEPTKAFQQAAGDERSLNMNLAAKAMDMLSDTDEEKISNTMRMAREAYGNENIINPNTGEPFASVGEAFSFYSKSTSDVERASQREQIQDRAKLYITTGDGLDDAETKATYDVIIKDNLTDKVGKNANGGFLSKAARQRKKTLEKSQPGTYFYDLENKVVRKFEGMEDGVPVFIEVDQETFEDLPEDAAESNVIKKELTKNEKGTTQEDFEQSTRDTTQNIKDRFSWSGEPQGVNPYDENRRITDIVQKTR